MMIYLAGPLFTLSELDFNNRLRNLLEEAGHRVWLPQEQALMSQEAISILSKLLSGLRASDVIIANMDGADPDSGTSWECGYAYAYGKPTILFRTDSRSRRDENLGPYNLMMWASATVRLDGPFASVKELASVIVPLLDGTSLKKRFDDQQSRLHRRELPSPREVTHRTI